MPLSNVLKKPFEILKQNPKAIVPYIILTALIGLFSVYLSLTFVQSMIGSNVNTSSAFFNLAASELILLLPVIAAIFIIAILATPFVIAMYINIADQGYQKKIISLKKAVQVAKAHYVNMLLLSILLCIIWLVAFVVLGAIFVLPAIVAGLSAGTTLWLILGAIISLVLLTLLMLYLYEAYAVLVLEKIGPISAVNRSLQISKKRLTSLFKVVVLVFIVSILFAITDSIVIFIIQLVLGPSTHSISAAFVSQSVNFILSGAFGSWVIMVPVSFYKEFVAKQRKPTVRKRKRRKRR